MADDEKNLLLALKSVFEWRGHIVWTAVNAYDALELIRELSFDAALIDARMPGDGLVVVEHLERDPNFGGPLVLMTGGLATDPMVNVGPNVLRLQKPFRFPVAVSALEDNASG